jgi:hypothetical protein
MLKRAFLPGVLVLMVVAFAAKPAGAARDAEAFRFDDEIHFTLTTGVYIPRFEGTVELGDTALVRPILIETELGLSEHTATFNGELLISHATNGWELFIGGFDVDADSAGTFAGVADFGPVELRPGDAFETDLEFTTFAVDLAPFRHMASESENGSLEFFPNIGVRYFEFDYTVREVGGGSVSTNERFGFVYAGGGFRLRYDLPDELPVLDTFEMTCVVDFGPALGGDGGWMWSVRGGMAFYVNDNVALHASYRLFEPSVNDSDLQFDAGAAGMFFGVTIAF